MEHLELDTGYYGDGRVRFLTGMELSASSPGAGRVQIVDTKTGKPLAGVVYVNTDTRTMERILLSPKGTALWDDDAGDWMIVEEQRDFIIADAAGNRIAGTTVP